MIQMNGNMSVNEFNTTKIVNMNLFYEYTHILTVSCSTTIGSVFHNFNKTSLFFL